MTIVARLLPEGEWEKLATRAPFDVAGLPDPEHWLIPVVEKDGVIVASCGILDTVHWDGFCVDDDVQKNPAVFRALLDLSIVTLQERGIPGVHLTVPNDRPDLQAMVEQYGFVPSEGKLYILQVPPQQVT